MKKPPILPVYSLLLCALVSGCTLDPDKRNPILATGPPALPSEAIETLIELRVPPGNVTVDGNDRVFFTFHPAARPAVHVAEILPDGGFSPFPNAAWQEPRESAPYFVSPLAVRADITGRLWVLDHGNFGSETPSLTAFDITTHEMVHRFEMPSNIAGWGSMVNDFWVDAERDVAYIADTSPYAFNPALIVYDIASGKARRLLEDHISMKPEGQHMVVQGRFIKVLGIPLRVAVDSIALSPDGETLYYGPLTGSHMYEIDTASLRDPHLSAAHLSKRVQRYAYKPSSDGIAADASGNLFITAIEHDAIWLVGPDTTLHVLAHDKDLLSWPDGLHLSRDGRFLYVTASELQHVLGADLDLLPHQRPFRVLRMELPGSRSANDHPT